MRYFAKHKARLCADGHKSLTEVNPEDGIFDLKQPYNLPFLSQNLRNILIAAIILPPSGYNRSCHVYLNRREKPLKEIFVWKPKDPPHVIVL